MITVQTIFNDLAYGELTSLAMAQSSLNTITEATYPKILSAINLGLIELYKRFPLKEKECKIHQHANVSTYYLRSDYLGDVDSMDDTMYLEENEDDPFDDDVLRVVSAYDEDDTIIPINNSSFTTTGIFTPAHDTIKMIPSDPVKIITIVYRAKYPEIVLTDSFNPEEEILYIPEYIREALLSYVASRVFTGKTSKAAEGETNISTTFMIQFENACRQIQSLDLLPEVNDNRLNFTKYGWV